MASRRLIVLGSAAALAVAAGFSACSLDLDESLIPADDAGQDGSSGGAGGSAGWSGSGGGSGTGGFGGVPPDAGPCTGDPQCAIDGGCLEGTCVSGTCAYAVCPGGGTCSARQCDFSTNSCGEETDLTFKVNQIDVGAQIGCSGVTQRCVATVSDYVVVGTSSGLVAWHIGNPLSPVKVAVEPPPFPIVRMVSNGNRLLIVGGASAGKLSIAWIDAPGTTVPTDLVSKAALVDYSGSLSAAYPADGESFFLVQNDAGAFYPSARLELPVTTGTNVVLHPSTGLPTEHAIVASSGSRLVGYDTDTSVSPVKAVFSLETQAGTSSAQNAGAQSLDVVSPASLAAHVFTSAHDGSILWATNRIFDDGTTTSADAVVLRWVLVGSSDTFDPTPEVVLETYSGMGVDELLAGPAAVIDANTAIATAAYPAATDQSTVRGVLRSGNALTLAGVEVLPFGKGSLGVVATRRFGLVLTPSTAAPEDPPNAALRIYAPNCGGS